MSPRQVPNVTTVSEMANTRRIGATRSGWWFSRCIIGGAPPYVPRLLRCSGAMIPQNRIPYPCFRACGTSQPVLPGSGSSWSYAANGRRDPFARIWTLLHAR